MKLPYCDFLLGAACAACAAVTLPLLRAADAGPGLHDVVWESPSRDSFGSMPLPGSRGAGANVWVSEGSLWIYLGHNGAYDEQGRLLKLGCLRLTPSGIDWRDPSDFRQEQNLTNGSIRVKARAKDGSDLSARLRFLGETLVIDLASSREIAWEATYGTWRDAPKPAKLDYFTGPEAVGADTVSTADGTLCFIHRNGNSLREENLGKAQRVPPEAMLKLLSNRNFGGVMAARGGLTFAPPIPVAWQTWQGMAWPGKTVTAKTHMLAVTLGAGKQADPATWATTAQALLRRPETRAAAEKTEDRRWSDFWDRSHIVVSDSKNSRDSDAFKVGRNYQLFRQLLACNQGGELPLKFNGFFNVDIWPPDPEHPQPAGWTAGFGWPGKGTTPDYRLWGQMFMSQNQRWIGWPTIAAGDADLLAPTSAFYRDRLAIAKARAKNLKAEGACYIEPLGVEGTCCVAPTADGLCSAVHLTYHFSMGLEHAWMTLQGHAALGTKVDADIPWMLEIVRFFDSFYRAQNQKRQGSELSPDGKLVLYPTNGLELFSGCTNAIETVAGLRRVTEGLLALENLPAGERPFLERVRAAMPALPTQQRAGKTVLAPAVTWTGEHNPQELPELYTVFPYRLAGVLHPESLTMARDTWDTLPVRGDKRHAVLPKTIDRAWTPTIANMAGLGLADEARMRIVAKFTDKQPSFRYPAFFLTGDGMPDFNHAATAAVGLQEMLMQCEPTPNGKILLFPAWPHDWNVDFKLHAPGQTLVECELRDGKVTKLRVTPESRRKDVITSPLQ